MKSFDLPLSMVDVVLFTLKNNQLYVLLQLRQNENDPFFNSWALPGVMVDPRKDDTLTDSALRALNTKAFLDDQYYIEPLEAFSGKNRDPRGFSISYAYICVVNEEKLNIKNINTLKFVQIDDIKNMNLAFDHDEIIEKARLRLKSKTEYSSLPTYLLKNQFTFSELKKAYDAILGFESNNSAFRKKISKIGFIKEVADLERERDDLVKIANRPPILYYVDKSDPITLFKRNMHCNKI